MEAAAFPALNIMVSKVQYIFNMHASFQIASNRDSRFSFDFDHIDKHKKSFIFFHGTKNQRSFY